MRKNNTGRKRRLPNSAKPSKPSSCFATCTTTNKGLNVMKQGNGATDFVFWARRGEMASNRREDHEMSMLSLHLVQNCMVYIHPDEAVGDLHLVAVPISSTAPRSSRSWRKSSAAECVACRWLAAEPVPDGRGAPPAAHRATLGSQVDPGPASAFDHHVPARLTRPLGRQIDRDPQDLCLLSEALQNDLGTIETMLDSPPMAPSVEQDELRALFARLREDELTWNNENRTWQSTNVYGECKLLATYDRTCPPEQTMLGASGGFGGPVVWGEGVQGVDGGLGQSGKYIGEVLSGIDPELAAGF